MKSTIKMNMVLTALIIALISFTACNKSESIITEDSDLDTALDQTLAADIFDEVSEISDEAIQHSDEILGSSLKDAEYQNAPGNQWHRGHGYWKGWYYDTINLVGRNLVRLSDCATITRQINETRDTMIMVIDWGEENCLGPDSVYRRGQFRMTRIGNFYWNGECKITFNFENYFVNDNEVIGTKTIHTYTNDEGQRIHAMNDEGSIILVDGAGTITWEANRTRTVIEGSDTRRKQDDKIEITGSSYGTDADGNTYSSEIVTPLIRIFERGCARFPVSGVVEIVKENSTTTIDYGDGSCDSIATVTKDGETTEVDLRKKRKKNN